MPGQAGIGVAPVSCNFRAKPARAGKALILSRKLQLRQHKPRVLAQEFVHLPHKPIQRDAVAAFLDKRLFSHVFKQKSAVGKGNLILEFRTTCP